jgi:Fe-S-cluster containining protein
LEEPLRKEIERRAASQIAAIEVEFPRLRRSPILDDWDDSELDRVAERFADLPCPALGADGSCRVYAFRPLACRTMGIPVEEQTLVQGACEVQTAVPIVRLPHALREEETRLAEQEAAEIEALSRATRADGEEILLAYGFLADRFPVP